MPSTSKIVLSIIAFYVIYGIFTYSATGHFLTLYFLNYFVLISVAIYSFLLNYKKAQSKTLALYAIALLCIASSHSLTLSYLNRLIPFSEKSTITANEPHKLIVILIFYSLLVNIFFTAKSSHLKSNWFWLPLVLLIGSLAAVLLNENLSQAILLSLSYFSFILISNRLNNQNIEVYSALVFQFALFLVIENIRFFTTGI